MAESTFFQDVYDVVRQIPLGKVTSYGAIAEYLGAKRSARMVGWAMNNVSREENIPAHRVLNQKGILSGKLSFGGSRMQELLEGEGIKIINDQVVNFEEVFWDPRKELEFL